VNTFTLTINWKSGAITRHGELSYQGVIDHVIDIRQSAMESTVASVSIEIESITIGDRPVETEESEQNVRGLHPRSHADGEIGNHRMTAAKAAGMLVSDEMLASVYVREWEQKEPVIQPKCTHRCLEGRHCGGCGCQGCGFAKDTSSDEFRRNERHEGTLTVRGVEITPELLESWYEQKKAREKIAEDSLEEYSNNLKINISDPERARANDFLRGRPYDD